MEADVTDVKEELAQTLFDHIPVGVGSQGIISTSAKDLEAALEMGMDWSLREVIFPPPSHPAPPSKPLLIPTRRRRRISSQIMLFQVANYTGFFLPRDSGKGS